LVVISGQSGDDARHYPEREVKNQIAEAEDREKK
jgi:hypothetical protein